VQALGDNQAVNDRLLVRTALKRMAQPEEICHCILFLLSDGASYVTGSVSGSIIIFLFRVMKTDVDQVINADGGFQ
jgi:NAD(P)-dependent dehydrogenase (short-subunit alcohol dehydrogenase family)